MANWTAEWQIQKVDHKMAERSAECQIAGWHIDIKTSEWHAESWIKRWLQGQQEDWELDDKMAEKVRGWLRVGLRNGRRVGRKEWQTRMKEWQEGCRQGLGKGSKSAPAVYSWAWQATPSFSPTQNQSRGKTETHWGILGKKRKVRDLHTRTKNKFATWHSQLLRAVQAITQDS